MNGSDAGMGEAQYPRGGLERERETARQRERKKEGQTESEWEGTEGIY